MSLFTIIFKEGETFTLKDQYITPSRFVSGRCNSDAFNKSDTQPIMFFCSYSLEGFTFDALEDIPNQGFIKITQFESVDPFPKEPGFAVRHVAPRNLWKGNNEVTSSGHLTKPFVLNEPYEIDWKLSLYHSFDFDEYHSGSTHSQDLLIHFEYSPDGKEWFKSKLLVPFSTSRG